MKRLIMVAVVVVASSAFADKVRGYEKKDGTYVPGYERTKANETKDDNYSTKGNYNPDTGKEGTKSGDEYHYGEKK